MGHYLLDTQYYITIIFLVVARLGMDWGCSTALTYALSRTSTRGLSASPPPVASQPHFHPWPLSLTSIDQTTARWTSHQGRAGCPAARGGSGRRNSLEAPNLIRGNTC